MWIRPGSPYAQQSSGWTSGARLGSNLSEGYGVLFGLVHEETAAYLQAEAEVTGSTLTKMTLEATTNFFFFLAISPIN
jgi:inner membrane protein involved in colicin E2 resistance